MTESQPTPTVHTVGELIQSLEKFDPSMQVRTAHSLTGSSTKWEWIILVSTLPPENETVGIFYMAPD